MEEKKTTKKKAGASSYAVYVSRETYKDLVRVHLKTGVPVKSLVRFTIDMSVAAFDKRLPDTLRSWPKGMDAPARPKFTSSTHKPVALDEKTHRKLKKFCEPLNMSMPYLIESCWPYLRKAMFDLPAARWANEVTMMNNVIGDGLKERGRFEEDRVRAAMEAKKK